MSKGSVTKHIEFEAAHMLYNYEGACRNLHGHSYKMEVEVTGSKNNDFGFILDFKILNSVLKEVIPDHMFITNTTLPDDCPERQIASILKANGMAIREYNFAPSAENMVENFAKEIQQKLDEKGISVEVTEVKLWETTNSHAIWRKY